MRLVVLMVAGLLWQAAVPHAAAAQAAARVELDVPFLPQTEALCGGAAVAMVFRYWGERYADVQEFAPLVDRAAGGIAQRALIDAVRSRGWRAEAFRADTERLRQSVRSGEPLVLLIEDRPGRYHYVVATGIAGDDMLVHDPAWGPSRVYTPAALEHAWEPAGFWALVIKPHSPPAPVETARASSNVPVEPAPRDRTLCDRLLDDALDEIAARGLQVAEPLLADVRTACPHDARPVSELAGVRFAARRWNDAAALAEEAAALDADNAYAWDVLGSSRFMMNDIPGALRAWNRTAKPRLDRIAITGVFRTRYALLVESLGLASTRILTEREYRLAQRRLSLLPTRSVSRIELRPDAQGFAVVDVALVEKSTWPRGIGQWGGTAARAAIDRELTATVPGRSGQGELWTASWRWWAARPHVEMSFAAPGQAKGFSGVWKVSGYWDEQSYRTDTGVIRERRLHAGVSHDTWWTPDLRFQLSGGVDAWNEMRRTVSLTAAIERRLAGDRIAALANASSHAGFRTPAFHTISGSLRGRSRVDQDGFVLAGSAAMTIASAQAPRALWPGAGDGQARPQLLRAHRLLDDGGIVSGPAFGRSLASVSVEATRWLRQPSLPRVAVAAFVDAAHPRDAVTPPKSGPVFVDVGAGVRIKVPGVDGTFHVDYAHGVRDGARALSVSVQPGGWN